MVNSSSSAWLRRIVPALAAGSLLATGGGLVTADAAHNSHGRRADRVVKASLTGAKEVPGPGDRNGHGRARIVLKRDRICFTLSWRRIAAPTAAHIHEGDRRTAGPVVVLLFSVPDGLQAPVHRVGGCTQVDRKLIREIRRDPRNYYVNIHNADFPAGAIRGQLH